MTDTNHQIADMIGDSWFHDHDATLTQHGPITVVDWKAPHSSQYAMQYLLSGHYLMITGDIGDALFKLTWPATIDSFDTLHIDYFLEKMTAHSENRWEFDTEQALSDLNDWKNLFAGDNDDAFIAELDRLSDTISDIIDNSGTHDEYVHNIHVHYENEAFEYFDSEDFSVIAEFGQQTPNRFHAYLEGLKMAYEQLANS